MKESPVIEFRDVYKSFGEHHVLKGVSVEVAPGSVHFIMGKSGAGKSVLTRQVIGLLRPDSGQVLVHGQDVSRFDEKDFMPIRQKCQMIFQHATLFEAMSVLENIAMPLRKRFGLSDADAVSKAEQALGRVHISEGLYRMPDQLGAGVKKRVAIARAIALEPEIMLYDEPTTSLDPVSARRTDRLIREMADKLGITSMVVSHDLTSLRSISDRVTFLEGGQIIFDGSAQDMLSSTHPILSEFVGDAGKRWSPKLTA